MAQLAIAWCLNNQNVSSVITGASKPSQIIGNNIPKNKSLQLIENLGAMSMLPKLTPSVLEQIEKALENKPT
jgi:aryl-alcohol dehydrogenase-like predicted oxidoreductase